MMPFLFILCCEVTMATTPSGAVGVPEFGGQFTEAKIANLRANVEAYDWARLEKEEAVAAASRWVALSDDRLWRMIPGQHLPRNIDPQIDNGDRKGGCPSCGVDVYANSKKYPWKVDVWEHPWKVICPSCAVQIPRNDFGSFYESGLDEACTFDPDKADRSLLFNADHPDENDPLHRSLVDDGWGFSTPDGAVNRFIGYYGYALWLEIKKGVSALAKASLYTGDPAYAHKCGVMLDRIADVYPEMDWGVYGSKGWFHSGSQDGGKIEGSIWEVGTVLTLARAYDMVKSGLYEQPALFEFLLKKGKEYKLPTPKGEYRHLAKNIEENLLEEFVKAVKTGRKIYGNEGDPQHCVVISALALNRQPKSNQWIEWVFDEGSVGQGVLKPGDGGHIPALIVGTIDRDGVGREGAPSYSLSWGQALGSAADLMREYEGYSSRDVYRDYPMFKRTITAGWRLGVLQTMTPQVGDYAACGTRRMVAADPEFIVRGYGYFRDPDIGLIAVQANGGSTEGLGRDIFAEDPDWIEKDLARLKETHTSEIAVSGSNRTGYGLVSVEFPPRDTGQAIWMYYGLNTGAGHKCALMFGYEAYGVSVCPPLGYRELWGGWPKSVEWEDNTISHNTVVVNEERQSVIQVGHPVFFGQFKEVGGFSVDASDTYRGITDIYRRTMATVHVGENSSYAVDVFHVRGGNDHLLSYHALPGAVATSGLTLTRQETGSYAGADIPYGTSTKGPRMGYSWLKDVDRDPDPPESFTLDVQGEPPFPHLEEDDLHVRYHSFSEFSDVAVATGVPPGATPPEIRYFLGHRSQEGGEPLVSTFVSIVEPYRSDPSIKKAARLKVSGDDGGLEAAALQIELMDGAVDYVMVSPNDSDVWELENGITFTGRLAVVRTREDMVEQAWLIRASQVSWGEFSLVRPDCGFRGSVVKMDRGLVERGHVWVDTELPTDGSLTGSQLIIANDGELNACYTIEGVVEEEGLFRIDCGEVSFVRRFKDTKDYDKGYVYNFEEGDAWVIPHQIHVDLR
jgi:hypothetical protein